MMVRTDTAGNPFPPDPRDDPLRGTVPDTLTPEEIQIVREFVEGRPDFLHAIPLHLRRNIYAGIDPGKSGAIAWTDSCGLELVVVGMPKHEGEILDTLGRLAGHLKLDEDPAQLCRFCLLERAQSIRGDGHVGSFSYGLNYGILRAGLRMWKVPWDRITPPDWHRELKIPRRNKKTESEPMFKARKHDRARCLFPKTKFPKYAADAVLLAELCRRKYAHAARPGRPIQEVLSDGHE